MFASDFTIHLCLFSTHDFYCSQSKHRLYNQEAESRGGVVLNRNDSLGAREQTDLNSPQCFMFFLKYM